MFTYDAENFVRRSLKVPDRSTGALLLSPQESLHTINNLHASCAAMTYLERLQTYHEYLLQDATCNPAVLEHVAAEILRLLSAPSQSTSSPSKRSTSSGELDALRARFMSKCGQIPSGACSSRVSAASSTG